MMILIMLIANILFRQFFQIQVNSMRLMIFLVAFFNLSWSCIAQEVSLELSYFGRGNIEVEGTLNRSDENSWSFVNEYAEQTDLRDRIVNLKFFDEAGRELPLERLSDGRFKLDPKAKYFKYEVISKPDNEISANVSWVDEQVGLLLLNDLMPVELLGKKSIISFKLPNGWRVVSSELQLTPTNFLVLNPEKAVFLIASDIRIQTIKVGVAKIGICFIGDLDFNENEAIESIKEIFSFYQHKFGSTRFSEVRLFVIPFPDKNERLNSWRAETRGATVTIIFAPPVFKSNALNLLNDQLRHELLHLWIPNSLNLSGRYDWFFEGFVVYQSLKAGVFLGQIRFDDFLATISRGYSFLQNSRRLSLIEASLRRWYDTNKILYAKGLIVAFLTDMKLIRLNGLNSEELLAEILKKHGINSARQDGNQAIIRILSEYKGAREVVTKHIEGDESPSLSDELVFFGLTLTSDATMPKVTLLQNLNSQQRNLLNKLGYNQWRNKKLPQMKLSRK